MFSSFHCSRHPAVIWLYTKSACGTLMVCCASYWFVGPIIRSKTAAVLILSSLSPPAQRWMSARSTLTFVDRGFVTTQLRVTLATVMRDTAWMEPKPPAQVRTPTVRFAY